eukprot:TRINITY_DN12690_c0_g1_i3.p1 TRINITY_DN12690_c0_g1~~TRINITY_DN12690_c0_g1_i3.p1  ORF type:complete len:233 (+),score=44.89 TRINITY_DN12690_c0_g1_i3:44-742(+)
MASSSLCLAGCASGIAASAAGFFAWPLIVNHWVRTAAPAETDKQHNSVFYDDDASKDDELQPGDPVHLKGMAVKAFGHSEGVIVSEIPVKEDTSPVSDASPSSRRLRVKLGSGKPVSVKVENLERASKVLYLVGAAGASVACGTAEHDPARQRLREQLAVFGDLEAIGPEAESTTARECKAAADAGPRYLAVRFERREAAAAAMQALREGALKSESGIPFLGRWHPPEVGSD